MIDFAPSSKGETTWTFSDALTKTNTKTVQSTLTNTWGAKASVKTTIKTGIPTVFEGGLEATVEASWQIAKANMKSTTETETVTLTYGLSGKISPGDEAVHCVASAVQGVGEFPYMAKTAIMFADPVEQLTFLEKGTYKVEQWMRAVANATNTKGPVETVPIKSKAPDGDGNASPNPQPVTGVDGAGPKPVEPPTKPAPGLGERHYQIRIA